MKINLGIFVLIVLFLVFGTLCHGQNVKPEASPDTCRTASINVLKNDYDANRDRLKVSKFNGKAFVKTLSITKLDTGVFTLDSGGRFSLMINPEFYGTAKFTYYINDGKTGATGTIAYIRDKITIGNPIHVECNYRTPGCVDDSLGYYRVKVTLGVGKEMPGFLFTYNLNGTDRFGIQYTDGVNSGYFEISEDRAIYIIKNTCKQ